MSRILQRVPTAWERCSASLPEQAFAGDLREVRLRRSSGRIGTQISALFQGHCNEAFVC